MYKPDYSGNSIVNLMSSIAKSRGSDSIYPELRNLRSEKLKDSRNIILLVIDGLGYNYLKDKKTLLNDYMTSSMDSVFLPTTACAITTFMTGVCPNQHANTGWYMLLKEFGVLSAILPFVPRYGGYQFSEFGLDIKKIFPENNFFKNLRNNSYIIQPDYLINTDFNRHMTKGAKKIYYKAQNLDDFFKKTLKAIDSGKQKKYVYSYWPEFDKICHIHGVNSKKSNKHFFEIENKLMFLFRKLKGTDTTLIITADHGFINTPIKDIIYLDDHPRLKECLTLPLSGEGRVAYCYVHPRKAKDFEAYVRKHLSKYCYCIKSEELINKGYYGLFKPNPKLYDRVGDYVLVFKENYIIKDYIGIPKKKEHIGHHGGNSIDEMLVPLIVLKF
jgi:predicted AlkP superfamily pyrophosphatase or phosphodiesterase